jgi:hypothetical protein
MTTTALLMMVIVQVSVMVITAYLFWKVLKTPPKVD